MGSANKARLALPVVFSDRTVRASGFVPPQDFKIDPHHIWNTSGTI